MPKRSATPIYTKNLLLKVKKATHALVIVRTKTAFPFVKY
jgi:hypothetical protein